ncbi:MAG: hypothetical protein NVS2B7_08820 [Herpetosiphon sp.]
MAFVNRAAHAPQYAATGNDASVGEWTQRDLTPQRNLSPAVSRYVSWCQGMIYNDRTARSSAPGGWFP